MHPNRPWQGSFILLGYAAVLMFSVATWAAIGRFFA